MRLTTTNMNDAQRLLLHVAFQNGSRYCDLYAWFVAKWVAYGMTCRKAGTEVSRKHFWSTLDVGTYKPFEDKGLCGTPLYMAPESVRAGLSGKPIQFI